MCSRQDPLWRRRQIPRCRLRRVWPQSPSAGREAVRRGRGPRLTVSDALPAANGLMTLIGRVGQSSACATDAANRSTAHRAPVDGRSDTNRTSQTLWIEHRRLPGESQPKLIAEVSARIKQGGQSAARCQKHNCHRGYGARPGSTPRVQAKTAQIRREWKSW